MPSLIRLKIILQSRKFLIISLIFLILYVLLFTKVIHYETKLNIEQTEISGKVISYIIDGNKLSMIIKGTEKVKVTYYIASLEEKEELQANLLIGEIVYLKGTLSEAYNNTVPNTFNYKQYLYNNQIYVTFQADNITLSNKTNFLNKVKTLFRRRIDSFGYTKAYLYAFILGETSYIDGDTYQDYQINGTTHLFAVSGMHISILVLFLTKLFKKIKVKEGIGHIIIILFLFFYMFLIGFTPSVVRGSLLYMFLLINRKLNLNLKTVNVLYLLFFFLLLINPFYIYQLGFIYSFITSFGLIIFSNKITGNYFMRLLKVSIIAFLFSLPITIYNFYEVNFLTVVNNLVIVPFVSIILFPLTLLTFLLPFLEGLLNIGINLLEGISAILNVFALNLVVPKVNILFFIIYYIVIYFLYKRSIKYFLGIIGLIIFVKLFPLLDNNVYVYFIDVGQGDSTVIIGENRSYALMIDTGGQVSYTTEEWEKKNSTYTVSSNTITLLKSMGITKLDTLIISHGDYDHMGEATNLVNNFAIKQVVFNEGSYNDLELELISLLEEKGIAYTNNIESITFHNNVFNFLKTNLYDNENDNSRIIYTVISGFSFLFMGDASITVEKDLINNYGSFRVDVLKVGHHGSRSSTQQTFIDNFNFQYAIISVGRNNRYNHPHAEVLAVLEKQKVKRTDIDGTILFKINNNKVSIMTYPP